MLELARLGGALLFALKGLHAAVKTGIGAVEELLHLRQVPAGRALGHPEPPQLVLQFCKLASHYNSNFHLGNLTSEGEAVGVAGSTYAS
ncbi:hypothetical protein F5Y13DRAFT_152802 [Hypoxylon sp. FL1857]|nr:hypothetical protein F5Y13DRAFT_152802 [Hypoxylon sp. FL1857]